MPEFVSVPVITARTIIQYMIVNMTLFYFTDSILFRNEATVVFGFSTISANLYRISKYFLDFSSYFPEFS
jgi:hypothetical protein